LRKYKNPARERTFDKVALSASYSASPILNADGTYFLDCNFNKNNINE